MKSENNIQKSGRRKFLQQTVVAVAGTIIKAEQINEAWTKVLNKEARYRYVIDAATF